MARKRKSRVRFRTGFLNFQIQLPHVASGASGFIFEYTFYATFDVNDSRYGNTFSLVTTFIQTINLLIILGLTKHFSTAVGNDEDVIL